MPQDSLIIIQSDASGDTLEHTVIHPVRIDKDNYNRSPDFFYGVAAIIAIVIILRLVAKRLDRRSAQKQEASSAPPSAAPVAQEPGALVYPGNELQFSETEMDRVLTKHLPYYCRLPDPEKERFRYRVQQFMQTKIFVIYDNIGFKEMPILLSATAVKLSFGLQRYLLPYYRSIHIFPAEFIGVEPTIRVLAGNVSGNRIHVSWKHFLEGIKDPDDGADLGLHEMAHAYYFQNFETGRPEDTSFVSHFHEFNTYGNQVFEQKRVTGNVLYSKYAMTNFQEFWAESVELFFEKPALFKYTYPELYRIMSNILNQDTAGDNLKI